MMDTDPTRLNSQNTRGNRDSPVLREQYHWHTKRMVKTSWPAEPNSRRPSGTSLLCRNRPIYSSAYSPTTPNSTMGVATSVHLTILGMYSHTSLVLRFHR